LLVTVDEIPEAVLEFLLPTDAENVGTSPCARSFKNFQYESGIVEGSRASAAVDPKCPSETPVTRVCTCVDQYISNKGNRRQWRHEVDQEGPGLQYCLASDRKHKSGRARRISCCRSMYHINNLLTLGASPRHDNAWMVMR
jgi:hypothetical protein